MLPFHLCCRFFRRYCSFAIWHSPLPCFWSLLPCRVFLFYPYFSSQIVSAEKWNTSFLIKRMYQYISKTVFFIETWKHQTRCTEKEECRPYSLKRRPMGQKVIIRLEQFLHITTIPGPVLEIVHIFGIAQVGTPPSCSKTDTGWKKGWLSHCTSHWNRIISHLCVRFVNRKFRISSLTIFKSLKRNCAEFLNDRRIFH